MPVPQGALTAGPMHGKAAVTLIWGPNYPRLSRIKQRWDPDGLFTVHHGVGSESWSPDGFTKMP
jgi:hypothetical protein